MKPGDLREWNHDTLRIQNIVVDEHDASSPFLVVEYSLVQEDYKMFEVVVVDAQGRRMRYDSKVIEEFTRSLE